MALVRFCRVTELTADVGRPRNLLVHALVRAATRPKRACLLSRVSVSHGCDFVLIYSCIVSADLAKLSAPLITTLIYSYDFVSRLSLGSIRDLKRISDWLSFAMDTKNSEGEKCKNIVTRALKYKAGMGGQSRADEKAWVRTVREVGLTAVPRSQKDT